MSLLMVMILLKPLRLQDSDGGEDMEYHDGDNLRTPTCHIGLAQAAPNVLAVRGGGVFKTIVNQLYSNWP